MQRRPRQREVHRCEAGAGQPEQQERVGGVAEGEDREDPEKAAETRRDRRGPDAVRRGSCRLPGRHRLDSHLGNEQHHPQGDQSGNQGQGEERSVLAREPPQKDGRRDRTDDGAGVIHRAVVTEDATALPWRGQGAEHGVARRAPQPFADAIGQPDGKHVLPRRRQSHQRPGEAGNRIAQGNDRLAPPGSVRDPAGDDLEEAADRVRRPFDDAERDRRGAKHSRQEYRQQRVDGFGGGVGKEARPAEKPDRRAEAGNA